MKLATEELTQVRDEYELAVKSGLLSLETALLYESFIHLANEVLMWRESAGEEEPVETSRI